jgi:hypothetical protein
VGWVEGQYLIVDCVFALIADESSQHSNLTERNLGGVSISHSSQFALAAAPA